MNTLFNLLIFLLPIGVILRITPYPGVAIYPYDLVVGLILLAFIFQVVIRKKKIFSKKLFIVISLFLLIGFVSLVINSKFLDRQEFFTSLAYLFRYAAYVSIIFAIQFLDSKSWESINKKLIFAGSVFLIAGFIQYIFYPSLRNLYYLGWDEHLYRLFSTFLDPNFAGAFLVLFLVLLSESILVLFRVRKKIPIISVLWILTLIAVFLTYSRSAFIMLLTSTVVFLVIHKFYKVMAIALVVFAVSFFIFPNPNIQGLNPLRSTSTEARLDSAKEAIAIISKNPILGVGFNAYRYARIRYGLGEEKSTLASNAGAGTDNGYLFVWATTGILGLLVFLDFWINVLKIVVPKLRSELYARVAFASLVGLLTNTIFINSLFYPPIMAWIFIIVGLTVNRRR